MAASVTYACSLGPIRLQAAKPASGKATPTPSAPAEGEGEEGGEPPLPKVCQPGRSAWLAAPQPRVPTQPTALAVPWGLGPAGVKAT